MKESRKSSLQEKKRGRRQGFVIGRRTEEREGRKERTRRKGRRERGRSEQELLICTVSTRLLIWLGGESWDKPKGILALETSS